MKKWMLWDKNFECFWCSRTFPSKERAEEFLMEYISNSVYVVPIEVEFYLPKKKIVGWSWIPKPCIIYDSESQARNQRITENYGNLFLAKIEYDEVG